MNLCLRFVFFDKDVLIFSIKGFNLLVIFGRRGQFKFVIGVLYNSLKVNVRFVKGIDRIIFLNYEMTRCLQYFFIQQIVLCCCFIGIVFWNLEIFMKDIYGFIIRDYIGIFSVFELKMYLFFRYFIVFFRFIFFNIFKKFGFFFFFKVIFLVVYFIRENFICYCKLNLRRIVKFRINYLLG